MLSFSTNDTARSEFSFFSETDTNSFSVRPSTSSYHAAMSAESSLYSMMIPSTTSVDSVMLKDDERNGKRYTTSQRQRISYGRYGDYRQRRFEEGGKYHLPRKHCIQHRDRSSSRNDSSRRYHDSKRRLRNQDRFTRQKRKYRERSSSRSLKYDHKRDRDRSRSPSSTGKKISIATNNTFTTTDCSPPVKRHGQFSDLPLEWWERDEDCKLAKEYHQDKIDRLWPSREDLVMQTTLAEEDTVLEPNMFPCMFLTCYKF